MRLNIKRLGMIIGMLFCLIIPFLLIHVDNYWTGDEVVSYSLANNDKGGFVFSNGRVTRYYEERIEADTLGSTLGNLVGFAKELIKERKNAEFFSYPRDPEVRLFTKEEINNWFTKDRSERFNFYTTWKQTLSDDGNSFWYSSVFNLFSSVFWKISGTKWLGFILNYVYFCLSIVGMFIICKKVGISNAKFVLSSLVWATSVLIMQNITNNRAYIFTTAHVILLIILHLNMIRKIKDKKNKIWKDYLLIFPCYVIGYLSHYTVALLMIALYFSTILFFKRCKVPKGRYIKHTIFVGCCGLTGILFAPTSVLGMLSSFKAENSGVNTGTSRLHNVVQNLCNLVFPNVVIALVMIGILGLYIVRCIKKRNEKEYIGWLGTTTLIFMIMVTIGTGRLTYGKMMMPCIAIMCVEAIEYVLSEYITDKRVMLSIQGLLLSTMCICGFVRGYVEICDVAKMQKEVNEVVEAYEGGECVMFRHWSQGYSDAVNLRGMSSAEVINIDTENWQNLTESSYPESDKLLAIFTNETYEEEVLEWIEQKGYELGECLIEFDTTKMYEMSKVQ